MLRKLERCIPYRVEKDERCGRDPRHNFTRFILWRHPFLQVLFACFNQKPQFQNDRDNSLVSTQPTKAGEKSKGSLAMASWLTNSILYLPSTYAYALPAGMQMITWPTLEHLCCTILKEHEDGLVHTWTTARCQVSRRISNPCRNISDLRYPIETPARSLFSFMVYIHRKFLPSPRWYASQKPRPSYLVLSRKRILPTHSICHYISASDIFYDWL